MDKCTGAVASMRCPAESCTAVLGQPWSPSTTPTDASGLKGLKRTASQVILSGQGLAGNPQGLRESGIPALLMDTGRSVVYLNEKAIVTVARVLVTAPSSSLSWPS